MFPAIQEPASPKEVLELSGDSLSEGWRRLWLWPGRGLGLSGGVITASSTLHPSVYGLAHSWAAACKSLVQKCWFYAVIFGGLAVPMPTVFVVAAAVFVGITSNNKL